MFYQISTKIQHTVSFIGRLGFFLRYPPQFSIYSSYDQLAHGTPKLFFHKLSQNIREHLKHVSVKKIPYATKKIKQPFFAILMQFQEPNSVRLFVFIYLPYFSTYSRFYFRSVHRSDSCSLHSVGWGLLGAELHYTAYTLQVSLSHR